MYPTAYSSARKGHWLTVWLHQLQPGERPVECPRGDTSAGEKRNLRPPLSQARTGASCNRKVSMECFAIVYARYNKLDGPRNIDVEDGG